PLFGEVETGNDRLGGEDTVADGVAGDGGLGSGGAWTGEPGHHYGELRLAWGVGACPVGVDGQAIGQECRHLLPFYTVGAPHGARGCARREGRTTGAAARRRPHHVAAAV